MIRWILLSGGVIVFGALSALSPERAPDARGLGGVCESTSDCQPSLRCNRDDAIDGQCSAVCSATSACQERFGAHSICLGADVCARTCSAAAACPSGSRCNTYGWCERE